MHPLGLRVCASFQLLLHKLPAQLFFVCLQTHHIHAACKSSAVYILGKIRPTLTLPGVEGNTPLLIKNNIA